jgi:hypothetical protein
VGKNWAPADIEEWLGQLERMRIGPSPATTAED